MSPRILLAHALFWPNVGRLSSALKAAGFEIGALAHARHPIHRMNSPNRTFVYSRIAPIASLRKAIDDYQPDLIVPCDDRIVGHLCSIFASSSRADVHALIERSLGPRTASGVLSRRSALSDLSNLPDVLVPKIDPIDGLADLREWIRHNDLPAVLKLDDSWGGQGVFLINKETNLARTYLMIQLRRSTLRGLKRWIFDGDIEALFHRRESITAQSYVLGRRSMIALCAWRGKIVAQIAAEVVRSRSAFGMATIVKIVCPGAMGKAAREIARHFELSGFYGLDFIIDPTSGAPYLLEVNPRVTQIDHLPGGVGHDLPAALYAALCGRTTVTHRPEISHKEIAIFPGEWIRDRSQKHLGDSFYDVPFDEPELAKYYGYNLETVASSASSTKPAYDLLQY